MMETQFNVNNINEFKNVFEKSNNELLFELDKVLNEISNLHQIITTPKSQKLQKLFEEYINNEMKVIDKNNKVICKDLEMIIYEYSAFIENIREKVDLDEKV